MSFRDLNHTLSCLFTLVLLAMNKEHSSYYDDAGEATSTLDVTTLSTLRDYGLVQYGGPARGARRAQVPPARARALARGSAR